MSKQCILGWALCLLLAQGLHGQGPVQDIPRDWTPAGMRPLAVAGATASSTFLGTDGPYAPILAVDGDRHTKWVGADEPSEKSPQWITLELLGTQEVTGLALFGEPPGNDGVVDAQVQAARGAGGEFATVATVKNARSASWLVKLDPVKTSKVRLVVTRSGGPSTHTDIYEIVVLGRPLSPAELKADTQQRVEACLAGIGQMKKAGAALAAARSPSLAPVARQSEALEAEVKELAGRFDRWDSLEEPARLALAETIQRLALHLARFGARIQKVAAVWPARFADIEAARKAAQEAKPTEKATAARQDKGVRMFNNRVAVRLDETSGAWEATWLGDVEAAVRGARFVVEVDGKELRPEAVQADIAPVADKLGPGVAVRQRWGKGVEVERVLRIYDGKPAVVVSGRITNRTDREVALGTARMVDLGGTDGAWWYAGQTMRAPGAVLVQGLSELICHPVPLPGEPGDEGRDYSGTGVLVMAHDDPGTALVLGYLTALEARPDVQGRFKGAEGGTGLTASLRYLGRTLPAGATLELDAACVSAHRDVYEALERYADAAAAMSRLPVRKGPNSLWCSWYAHRMAMTEDLVLANAAVAAKHFKPLGLEIMQLDHGWQRGDITGDWVVNERFPHGLKWLAQELKTRHGLRLGVWISPTDVAETSQTYREHADWLLKGADGKPAVNWRWYWKPNPNCYELDASHPGGARFIRDTFARLSAEGVSYYKIDFIAACGGEHFAQHDPAVTRGWGVLRRAMEAIREGAGQEAWIRYCQTPPLLSIGLADSAYGGNDTLDAGLGGRIDVLRTNARSLAAGYWINDRLYHREVCDMSVRMQAPVEEVRMRLALMALAGCSISFSDEFQYLPLSRIRMMQQALPPGVPAMKPLDLLQRQIPSIWRLHCKTPADEWDAVGLFNFEDRPEERTIELSRLGLAPGTAAVAFEFWEEKLLGIVQDRLTVAMQPQTSRIVLLRRVAGRPQLVGTNMHVLGGWHEVKKLAWDEKTLVLAGRYARAPGLEGKAFFYVPSGYQPHFEFPLNAASARLTNVGGGLWMQEIEFTGAEVDWSIPFDGPATKVETKPKVEPNQTQ